MYKKMEGGSINLKKVAIFGSCVSRDIFNSQFNPHYKENFEVVSLQNQTSILSLMSPKIIYEKKDLEPLKGWDRDTIEEELEKSFLNDLIEVEPDLIIIDFFTDAWFKTISVQNSFITVNEWKTTKTKFYENILQLEKPFFPNEEQLKRDLQCFHTYIEKNLPETKVVLNQARAVYSYIDAEGKEVFFSNGFINQINKRWQLLDNIFIEIAHPIQINVMKSNTMSDPNHPWGIGYVHYTSAYYNDFLNKLTQVMKQPDKTLDNSLKKRIFLYLKKLKKR